MNEFVNQNTFASPEKDLLQRYLLYSIVGHGVFLIFMFVRALILPMEPIEIQNAIRVDIVGLPQKLEELPAPSEASLEAPAAKTNEQSLPVKPAEAPPVDQTPKVDLSEREKPREKIVDQAPPKDFNKLQKNALNHLKTLEALENLKKGMKSDSLAKNAEGSKVAGQKEARGNALTGLERLDFDRYFGEIETRVRGMWSLPQWLSDAGLTATIQVRIDDKGFVIEKKFLKSSGHDVFDAKVVEAIDASSPFPPPPERLKSTLAYQGVIFKFPK